MNWNFKAKVVTLFFVILLTACVRIPPPETKVFEPEFVKPNTWLSSWECGQNICNDQFTITHKYNAGRVNSMGWDYQIQAQYDSNYIQVSLYYASAERCELAKTDTLFMEQDTALFAKFKAIKDTFEVYKGELEQRQNSLDSPVSFIAWGKATKCAFRYVSNDKYPILYPHLQTLDSLSMRALKSSESARQWWDEYHKSKKK